MLGASPQHTPRQGNSYIVALLSLKVLLLAFFILLNSLASFEAERGSAVVDSVREAFQGLLPAEHSASINPSGLGLLKGGDDVVDALKQLFGRALPLVELPITSGARVLQLDLAAADLYAEEVRVLSP